MSVSICSNVPGYTDPIFFKSNGDSQDLVNRMGDGLELIADHAYASLHQQFKPVFDYIESHSIDPERHRNILKKYLKQMPVVGFNSANYDINLAKPYMINRFILGQPKKAHVIKKGNEFISITTEKLIFLDVTKFIAPGFTYSKYLKAFGIEETKGHFCYDYITDLEKLEETSLPQKEAFFNKLKNESISDEDYAQCQRVWQEEGMKTIGDFLRWYNDKDVKPFLEALNVQVNLYKDQLHLDMLKDAKTIPGLTLKYLFSNMPNDTFFSLINEKNKDLHDLIQSQIVGGPSLIFT